ncbi:MAG: NADH:flavin oxidoreductase/NADH oxidase, partial [Bacillota bacterium]|nr:NADH:flavin oxidoreductase/NADH oxidase [Bacillota bacterium]
MKKLFTEFSVNNLTVKNRIVMPPMCMYMAKEDGLVTDWHIHHYATRAMGEIGLIIQEATAISPEGRISDNDLGIWSDDHVAGLKRITDAVHQMGGKIGIQIGHAGRKANTASGPMLAPSAIAFREDMKTPEEMDEAQIRRVIQAFGDAARRAVQAGYDLIEIHGAHGYLVSSFLSPISNKRSDRWGCPGTLFMEEVIRAMKAEIPADFPLTIRISASDYLPGGMDDARAALVVGTAKQLGICLINVSSGGVVEAPINAFPGYQVPFATRIKAQCDIPVIAGGLLDSLDLVTDIIENDRADLVYLGRALLRNPYWALDAMARLKQ